jgi:glycosyltransferase involved in cell wall biosynthesis
MKIAMFTWELDRGPFALGCGAYAKGFVECGIEQVDVLYLNRHQESEILPVFPPEANFVRLPVHHSRNAPLALMRYLKAHRPDLFISMPVHVNIATMAAQWLARDVKTKFIISEQSTTSHKVYVQNPNQFGWRILPPLMRAFYPNAAGIVCNSQEVADDLIRNLGVKMPANRLAVIPPPVDMDIVAAWKDEPVTDPWLNKWLNNKEHPVIVSIARLAVEKNLPLLIEAFARVREHVDCRLLILGEGPERGALEAMIEQKGLRQYVALPGHLRNPWAILQRSDLFVLTSLEEAFGRVIVEAMACGLPVIATDAIGGGPRMILEESRYGKLISSGDLDALTGAVRAVMEDPKYAQDLREQGATRATFAAPKRVAKAWLDFAATV